VVEFLGMQCADGTGAVAGPAGKPHTLHMTGVWIGNVPVMVSYYYCYYYYYVYYYWATNATPADMLPLLLHYYYDDDDDDDDYN